MVGKRAVSFWVALDFIAASLPTLQDNNANLRMEK